MERTLLLSAGFEPVRIISWKKAVILTVLEKVDVLEQYNTAIHSPTTRLMLPAVVKLKRMVKPRPRKVKFSRQNLYYRDNYTCQYCQKSQPPAQLTYDHVVPRSRGGKTTWTNIVTACIRCNLKKGNKLPHQVNLHLMTEPREPKWLPAIAPDLSRDATPDVWGQYLAWQE